MVEHIEKDCGGDSQPPRLHRTGFKRGIYILPSLFTTASLFCGFYSIIQSIQQDFLTAAWAIMFCGVFDGLDGRIARLTKSQTEFGLQYDSLVDLASFGLAPALLIFNSSLYHLNRVGMGVAFLFFACGALRLARFNVRVTSEEKRYFQGLPIPLAAYAMASTIIFQIYHGGDGRLSPYVSLLITLVLALLMVSSVHYRSFKQIDFSKPTSFLFLVVVALIFVVWLIAPQYTMFICSVTYVLSGMVEEVLHLRHRKLFLRKMLARKGNSSDESNIIPISPDNKNIK